MRVEILTLAVLLVFGVCLQTADAQEVIFQDISADGSSMFMVYIEGGICYWIMGRHEFKAFIKGKIINLYINDQKVMSYFGLNNIYVNVIGYQNGVEISRYKCVNGTFGYGMAKATLKYYGR